MSSLRPTSNIAKRVLFQNTFRRAYGAYTELPRPPPSKLPDPEVYSSPSRPREYYSRPHLRELPPLQRKWPVILALGVFGTTAWGLFYLYVANQERLASSVYKQILTTVRDSSEVQALLGEAIRAEPVWYLNGDPWVNGSIRLLQGNVDLSFRVKGHKGSGTLYFTSIRKNKGEPFTILRFKVISDNGQIIEVPTSSLS